MSGATNIQIKSLHNSAMDIAEEALMAKRRDNMELFLELSEKAFDLEKEAAMLAHANKLGQPTESVLLRSAATLAFDCHKFREAEKLVTLALSGEPPHEIAEELRNLYEEINFDRHLALNNIELSSSEFQFVVAGKVIGFGRAKSEPVLERLNILETLTYRTVERKKGLPFRKKGKVSKVIKVGFQQYLSAPRAASFALTIKIGGENLEQTLMNGIDAESSTVIEDLAQNIEYVETGNLNKLKDSIKDELYFQNFLSLTKELAPDGEDVNLVGFTISNSLGTKLIKLTKNRKEITKIQLSTLEDEALQSSNTNVEFSGKLYEANGNQNSIRLNTGANGEIQISVPEGLSDIVKKYWDEDVIVTVQQISQQGKKTKYILLDLRSEAK